MSQNQQTRSKLTIDAVAQAAATGVATALNPLKKLDAIAGLAGFVLRLFRSKEQLLPMVGVKGSRPPSDGAGQDPARIWLGSSYDETRQYEGTRRRVSQPRRRQVRQSRRYLASQVRYNRLLEHF